LLVRQGIASSAGRLLRILLPSVVELQTFTWNRAFESCFLEVQAPDLKCITIFLENEQVNFSWNMLAAAPALVRINLLKSWLFKKLVLQVVTSSCGFKLWCVAEHENITLHTCPLEDGDLIKDFLVALEESGCAKKMICPCLDNCEVDNNGVHALADFFCPGALSSLKDLELAGNSITM